ncbi:LacI family DNA-binding transcriptional regulator [Petrotoga halophila]|uniref:LacI family DNA-binding transcriptional regulator n=1 Tax=Petrotoga halophila TaxID=301141 RepID=UPI001FE2EA4A|nr:LacI family DNA-binding transcriptional regulator [Petrotoga halophila]
MIPLTLTLKGVVKISRSNFVTIKDIAERAGVSVNTVSRALNDKPDINPQTKEKIEKIAQELGYVKNIYATMLKSNVTHTIGVIMPDSSNPFFSEVFKGIDKAARENNYQIIIMNSEGLYENEEKFLKTLLERRVDGILLFPMQKSYEDIQELIKEHFPIVLVGREIDGWNVDEIFSDEEKGGYLATKYLIEKGCKKIKMITDQLYNSASYGRLQGYKKALKEKGLTFSEDDIKICEGIHEGYHVKAGYDKTMEMIRKKEEFDGIFCYNDLIAYGAIKALKENNLKIPQNVSVVGYDDIAFSRLIEPELTTVKVKKFEMGYEAFQMLYKRIKSKQRDNSSTRKVLDVELVVRNS